jgi:hypothetical protein
MRHAKACLQATWQKAHKKALFRNNGNRAIEAEILLAKTKRLEQWNARSVPHPGFWRSRAKNA